MRTERRPLFGFFFRLLWRISVVWAVVSGFAHLPVIYRYAEAALPWLRPAAYSGTVAHYWAAAAMLCLTSYAAIVWLVRGSRSYSLTPFGMLRLVLLALLMLSGLGLILHNFQDFSFYGPVYTLIKHGHLGCALLWAHAGPCPSGPPRAVVGSPPGHGATGPRLSLSAMPCDMA